MFSFFFSLFAATLLSWPLLALPLLVKMFACKDLAYLLPVALPFLLIAFLYYQAHDTREPGRGVPGQSRR
jgi:hypothetical protein